MVDSLSDSRKFKERVEKEVKNRQLVKFLIMLRCKESLTQAQIAKKIGCTQSRISKIEGSEDSELSIGDLVDYAKALDLKLEIGYRKPSAKIVDLIKYHALRISAYLNQLVDMAKDKQDEVMVYDLAELIIQAKKLR